MSLLFANPITETMLDAIKAHPTVHHRALDILDEHGLNRPFDSSIETEHKVQAAAYMLEAHIEGLAPETLGTVWHTTLVWAQVQIDFEHIVVQLMPS